MTDNPKVSQKRKVERAQTQVSCGHKMLHIYLACPLLTFGTQVSVHSMHTYRQIGRQIEKQRCTQDIDIQKQNAMYMFDYTPTVKSLIA